ncbi:MAG: hypothetical protein V1817_01010 [Candidatus Micrarchaeota archaeon]
MVDSPENALAEAREWLTAAEKALGGAEKNAALCGVCCAQAIHAVIRANDSLTLKFLGRKATRHEDAPMLFRQLVKQQKIIEDESKFANALVDAMLKKSGADYGKQDFKLVDARKLVANAREFVEMASRHR